MLLDQADLCKQAAMVESMELMEMKFYPAFMSKLEKLLSDVYFSLLPSSSEYEQRKQLVQAYNMTVKSIFGNIGGFPAVEAFGSFTMNIFTAKSDLDLSINFDNNNAKCLPRDQAISVLRRIAKVLRRKQSKGHLSGVLPILSAKVPVLKAVDCKTGIECDISVENKDGISRSLFFSIISSIDERFRIISFLMKAWAKANDINSSKDHTMNSLSIISLVALHFQTRDPPILPPFSTLLRDGTDITNLHGAVPVFMNLATRNKESVAQLFVALLAKLTSVEKLWELGLCASNFEGSWISKTWTSKFGSNMNIEDFLDRNQNFARSVGKFEMPKIYNCLRGSLGYLSSSMQGQIEMSALGTLLFGSVALHTQTSHASTNATAAANQKLFINSSHPRADVIARALGQKQTSNESTLHTKTTARMSLKRKQISTKSAPPLASVTGPASHTAVSTGMTLKTKSPILTAKSELPVHTRVQEINTISLGTKPPVRTHVTNAPKNPTHVTNVPKNPTHVTNAPKNPTHVTNAPKNPTHVTNDAPKKRTHVTNDDPKNRTHVTNDAPKKRTHVTNDDPKKRTHVTNDDPKKRTHVTNDAPKKRTHVTNDDPKKRTHVTNDDPNKRTHVTNDSPKRPRYNNAAGELPPGYLQNQNYIYFSRPMMLPDQSYHRPPLNVIGHLNASALQPPPQHRLVPHHRPVPQYRPMAPESSGMFRYYSNPVQPMVLDGRHNPSMFPGYTSNAGYPQFVPQRSLGSNHP